MLLSNRRCLCLVLVCSLLTGCGSKLTADRFDKVQEGMTLSQVQRILGKPHGVVKTGQNAQMLGWESGDAIVNVMMANGKVFAKNQENLP
jgi:hypothetical protein